MTGKWHYTSIKDLRAAITTAREEAETQAKRHWHCVFARAMNLATAGHGGSPCRPREEADCPGFSRTWKEVAAVVADVEANHPHVREVYVSGGYDGAESPHARWVDGDYEPWESSWQVVIWERT